MADRPDKDPKDDDSLAEIVAAIAGLRFGSVEIVIHDGRIVQIVRTEKVRIEGKPPR